MSVDDRMKPNAGRIYDYLLGGHHNFEADRQVAERFTSNFPSMPLVARLQRWCLQDVVRELLSRGMEVIIDFASGLPTQDHIHEVVPPEVVVIYSDKDPLVVEYGREILQDVPNAHIFQADARRPEDILENPEVQKLIGDRRDVGLVLWGVSSFLPDEDLRHAFQYLYEWSGPKAVLAFNAQLADVELDPNDPIQQKLLKTYREMGSPLYIRTLEQYRELIQPWKPDGGFVSLLEWHDFDPSLFSDRDRALVEKSGGGYGAYLIK
ncbi:MAG TPA: hypothetical protein G4O04_09595 [Anaerolineae bacterium]|nr:hypothetical protein [Anaerolineae bacterium]HID84544.1 hypothetical protein [Anaerolineales bacterium]HIQ08851.1 hypothetical protein [Anaerolineaceae bacterium]